MRWRFDRHWKGIIVVLVDQNGCLRMEIEALVQARISICASVVYVP